MFNYLTIAYGLFLWYFVLTKGFFFFTFINDQFNTDTLSILTLSTVPLVSVLFSSTEYAGHAMEIMMSINLLHVDGIVICSGDGLVYEVPRKFLFTVIPSALPCMFRLN